MKAIHSGVRSWILVASMGLVPVAGALAIPAGGDLDVSSESSVDFSSGEGGMDQVAVNVESSGGDTGGSGGGWSSYLPSWESIQGWMPSFGGGSQQQSPFDASPSLPSGGDVDPGFSQPAPSWGGFLNSWFSQGSSSGDDGVGALSLGDSQGFNGDGFLPMADGRRTDLPPDSMLAEGGDDPRNWLEWMTMSKDAKLQQIDRDEKRRQAMETFARAREANRSVTGPAGVSELANGAGDIGEAWGTNKGWGPMTWLYSMGRVLSVFDGK